MKQRIDYKKVAQTAWHPALPMRLCALPAVSLPNECADDLHH